MVKLHSKWLLGTVTSVFLVLASPNSGRANDINIPSESLLAETDPRLRDTVRVGTVQALKSEAVSVPLTITPDQDLA